MKKGIFLQLFFFTIFLVNAEPNRNVIKEIKVVGLKSTNRDYVLKTANLKVGGNWSESVRKGAIAKITSSLRKIIEEVAITSQLEEDGVVVTLTIREKVSFIVVPFFTYGNQSGIKPKVIFRHYNLGGYGKYLGAKMEFVPTDFFSVSGEYVDGNFLNRDDMNFKVSARFETSIPNYYVTDYVKDLPPLGATNWNGTRWNEENLTLFTFSANYSYRLPWRDAVFSTNAYFWYSWMEDTDDAGDKLKVPINIITPVISAGLAIPITEHFTVTPNVGFSYRLEQNELERRSVLHNTGEWKYSAGEFFNYYIPRFQLSLGFPFRSIGLTYAITGGTNYFYGDHYSKGQKDYSQPQLSSYYKEHAVNFILTNTISRNVTLAPGLTNGFSISNTIHQRVFHYNDQYKGYQGTYQGERVTYREWKSVENTLRTITNFNYNFNYNFFKEHAFALKLNIFYYFNDVNTKDDYKAMNEAVYSATDRIIREVDSDYMMFENVGDFIGYAGGMLNLSYKLPLFNFKTPNFLSFQLKRALEWDAALYFFVDLGLAQNYPEVMKDGDYKSYIINRNALYLCPGLAAGVRLEVVPKFIPVKVGVSVGLDLYKMIKTKNVSANIVFTIGIDNQ